LKELYGFEVGYADHTSWDNKFNSFITAIGYQLGAKIIEKHYSPTAGVKRNDFESSVSIEQLKELKELLDVSKKVLGDGDFSLNRAELEYGKIGIGKKAMVVKHFIKKGTKLNKNMISYKLTNVSTPMKQNFIEIIDNFETVKDIEKDEILDFNKIERIKSKL